MTNYTKYWWSEKNERKKKDKVCNELTQVLKYLPRHSFLMRDTSTLSAGNWTEDAKDKSDDNSAVRWAGGFQSSAPMVKHQKKSL